MVLINPRTVKEEEGSRPFQRDTLRALRSDSHLIMVEAPVGAGKSYIIRRIVEDEHLSKRPIILTYPTKILMNAQVNALKREIPNIRRHWPDDPEVSSEITLFEYSSVNFEIPDYWGIGKSVSRGFGTVMKVKSEK